MEQKRSNRICTSRLVLAARAGEDQKITLQEHRKAGLATGAGDELDNHRPPRIRACRGLGGRMAALGQRGCERSTP